MSSTLDIAPLRSFVTVADAGGFQRAADVLTFSPREPDDQPAT